LQDFDFNDTMEGMNHHYVGKAYSLVKELTVGQIKRGEYAADVDTSSLEKRMQDKSVHVAIQGDGKYFHGMRKVKSAPYLYYRQGDHNLLHRPLLAIV
jgi:predicted Rossmann fold nucleotide-binding protein DprA/Smf involved in DNA uptake